MPSDYGLVRYAASATAPLPRFLTLDAVPHPRNGFQPLQFYVAAAFGALLTQIGIAAAKCLGLFGQGRATLDWQGNTGETAERLGFSRNAVLWPL
jgi:hypothetical protein